MSLVPRHYGKWFAFVTYNYMLLIHFSGWSCRTGFVCCYWGTVDATLFVYPSIQLYVYSVLDNWLLPISFLQMKFMASVFSKNRRKKNLGFWWFLGLCIFESFGCCWGLLFFFANKSCQIEMRLRTCNAVS